MSNLPLAGLDAAILCGGLGTRLRGVVDDVPKPLAPVEGRAFLFYLLDLLALRGARTVTLCCGYKADLIASAVRKSWMGMPINYAIEKELLGTGGALRLAFPHLQSEQILVMNGDSILEPDFAAFRRAGSRTDICIALLEVENGARFGSVRFAADGLITEFKEKSECPERVWINSGMYLMQRSVLGGLREGKSSLERDLMPSWIAAGRVAAFPTQSAFVDIGLPDAYGDAGATIRKLGLAPHEMFREDRPPEGAIVRFGVCTLIFDERGRILMEKRSDCGLWGLPGGRMDAGETVIECALREAREETGLEVEITRFVGIFSDPRRRTVKYPDNGDVRQLVDAVVTARPVGGRLALSSESEDLRWFAVESLPLDTVPPVIEMVRAAAEPELPPILR